MTDYAHPEVLVSTEWVAEHLNDSNVRLVESNEDILLYSTGHIPGQSTLIGLTTLTTLWFVITLTGYSLPS
jgi:3-mercaptopyruvate sulfurtransferase SseA